MKKIIFTIVSLLFFNAALFSQEDKWEQLANRIAEKAERLAEQIERQAGRLEYQIEANAPRWEAEAQRISRQFEDRWNKDWGVRVENFPQRVKVKISPDKVFLGVESTNISREKAKVLGFENPYGSYVSKVVSNSAAAAAGLLPFDYIYGVNDQRTSDNQDLSDILEDYEAGDEVTLHYIRKGEKHSVNVRLGSYEDQDWEMQRSEGGRGFLGVSPAEDEHDEDFDGVSIEVVENSTAQELGLKAGDVIVGINGYPILDWDDVATAISNTKPGDTIEVVFERDAKEMSAKGTVKSYREAYPGESPGLIDLDIDWDEMSDIKIDLPDDLGLDLDQENRAFLGIYTEIISPEKAKKLGFDNPYGSYVTGVLKNTAAEKAGIKPLDYIFGIDEYRVGENQSLGGILKKFQPGDKVTIHFMRKGKKFAEKAALGSHADAEKVSRNSCEDPFLGIIQVGGSDAEGIAVKPVSGSTAEELGLKEGDVITSINGYKMIDWQDITAAIEMLNPGETIAVEYLREGKTMKSSKPIRSYAETKKCKDCDCGDKEEMIIKIEKPDINFSFTRPEMRKEEPSTRRLDVATATVKMENVTAAESGSLKSKGVDISQPNTLNLEDLQLSPNAGAGMFSLSFRLPNSGNTLVRFYNNSGRIIYEYDLGKFSGNFDDTVDLSQNGPGDYYLQVTQGGNVFTKKVVLTKS